MTLRYTPDDHYWTVAGNPTQRFSSRVGGYVSDTDPGYLAFLAEGNLPTAIPSEDALFEVLVGAGVAAAVPATYSAVLPPSKRPPVKRLDLLESLADIAPTASPRLVDDFLSGSNETGEVGQLGWNFANGSATHQAAAPGRPGIIRRTSGTTANQVATLHLGVAATTALFAIGDVRDFYAVLAPRTAGSDYNLRFGFMPDVGAAQPASGVYFEKLSTDTGYHAVCRNSGVQTRSPTAKTANAGEWTKFRIRWYNAELRFSVDGGTEYVISTNLPPGSLGVNLGFQIAPTTTAARSFDLDYVGLRLADQVR